MRIPILGEGDGQQSPLAEQEEDDAPIMLQHTARSSASPADRGAQAFDGEDAPEVRKEARVGRRSQALDGGRELPPSGVENTPADRPYCHVR